jgi:hypothetical protein
MEVSREVDFTMTLAIPDWARWIASDASGCVWAFEMEPTPRTASWDNGGGFCLMIAEANWWYVDTATLKADLYAGWRDSLKAVA